MSVILLFFMRMREETILKYFNSEEILIPLLVISSFLELPY